MQDRYVGDVGDFGKYGLLRALCTEDDEPTLTLGVVWYLVPDEAHNFDGRHVTYLMPSKAHQYRRCDTELYDSLLRLVLSGQRSVANVRAYGLLPHATAYFESRLVLPPARRSSLRAEWCAHAQAATDGCDIVFLDPDNGLLPPDSASSSAKHVRYEELKPYLDRGQSLVVYHHLGREGTHEQQIGKWLGRLRGDTGREVFALRFTRGSGRAYFILPSHEHRARLRHRAERLMTGFWSAHFTAIGLPSDQTQ